MKKIAVIAVSAMFALGAAQVASAANEIVDGNKVNFANGNAFAYGQDKNNVPGTNNGLGNAFGSRDKVDPATGNNSIRNDYPLDPTAPNNGLGNAFGTAP